MKRRIMTGLACLASVVILSGCSSSLDCLEPQPYMQAQQLPPLQNPTGLDVPPPKSDMQIPEVANGPVGHYDQPIPGRPDSKLAHCLIAPPPMPQTGA